MGLFPYIGGDGQFIKVLKNYLVKSNIFIELFGGAGTATLYVAENRLANKIIWNDLDDLIYAAFYVVKYYPEQIWTIQKILNSISRFIEEDERIKVKKMLQKIRYALDKGIVKDIVKKGIWTIVYYHACHCWRSGPMLRWVDFPDRYKSTYKYLFKYHQLLQNVEIYNCDYKEILEKYINNDDVLIYIDPPHTGKHYYRIENVNLHKLARYLENPRAKILVKASLQDKPLLELEKRGFKRIDTKFILNTSHKKEGLTYVLLKNY